MSKIITELSQKENPLKVYLMPEVSADEQIMSRERRAALSLEEVYEKGVAEGRKLEKENLARKVEDKISELQENNRRILKEIEHLKKDLYESAEKDVVDLSLSIAKKIMETETEQNREIALNVARATLAKIGEQQRIKIKVSPVDYPLFKEQEKEIQAVNPGLKEVSVEQDEGVAKGGCIIETMAGDFNATLEEQFRYLSREMKKVQEKGKQGQTDA